MLRTVNDSRIRVEMRPKPLHNVVLAVFVSCLMTSCMAMVSHTFKLMTDSNGTHLCSTSQPSSVVPMVDSSMAIRCGSHCNVDWLCVFYQFKVDLLQCELFDNVPNNLTVVDQCTSYASIDLDSCFKQRQINPTAPNGAYWMRTITGRLLKVYCDMTTNGGGYTFINPVDLAVMTEEELLAMYTDNQSVVLQMNMTDGTQRVGILGQLPAYSNFSLTLGLNEHNSFSASPVSNIPYLGANYVFLGFIPEVLASVSGTRQGLTVNGQLIQYVRCNTFPTNFMALFPIVPGKTPDNYPYYAGNGVYTNLMNAMIPSAVTLPADFFMFLEGRFGGCGSNFQVGYGISVGGALGAAFGFR